MNSLDRRRLRENYVELVRNLNPEDVTDYLYQEQILSDEDCENIFSGATRAQRMRLFLALLPKKGPNSYSKFITAMQQSGYDYLVEILTNTPLDPDEIDAESVAPDSPPILLQEIRLHTLKEKLEHQSEVVKSMQSEMKQVSLSSMLNIIIISQVFCIRKCRVVTADYLILSHSDSKSSIILGSRLLPQ